MTLFTTTPYIYHTLRNPTLHIANWTGHLVVTSFRPRDATLHDSSVLTTIRPLTEGNELYFQWTQYRIEVLQERLRRMGEVLEEEHRAKKPTDVKRIKQFLKLQEEWLVMSNEEIIEDGCYIHAS